MFDDCPEKVHCQPGDAINLTNLETTVASGAKSGLGSDSDPS
jgi:hypothetical protein